MRRLIYALAFLIPFWPLDPACATEVQEVISPGGIKAWLVEEHALPLVAVKIVFTGSGFAYDAKGKEGRAGMAAALLTEGAGDLDSAAFNKTLEDHAIRLNIGTDEDFLRASLESLSDQKERAFALLGIALSKPRFDEAALERVRRQTLSLLTQQEGDPGYLLHRGWQKVAFGSHPYGNPILGTEEAVAKLGRADFEDYRQRYLTRSNMIVAVVGDVTAEELKRLLDEDLGGLPAHYDSDVTVEETHLPAEPKQVITKLPIPQTLVMFGTEGIRRDDPDFYSAFVMNQVLGGGGNLTARLGQEIREKRGLAYAVATQLDPMAHAAAWEGEFATRNPEVGAALATLKDTLKDFSEKGPTSKELADAKQYLIGSFVLNLGSNADIAEYLISMQVHRLGRDYLDKRNGYIAKVTRSEVAAVARKLADPDRLLVVMVGQPNLSGEH